MFKIQFKGGDLRIVIFSAGKQKKSSLRSTEVRKFLVISSIIIHNHKHYHYTEKENKLIL